MAFNRDAFIRDAIKEYSPDEINQVLTQMGETQIDPVHAFLGKVYKADWLPVATGTVGAGVGTMGLPGAGTFYGGAGGYGAGKMVQQTAGELGGFTPTQPEEQRQQLGSQVGQATGFGAGAWSLYELSQALKFLLQPTKTAGSMREKYLNKLPAEKNKLTYEQAQEALLKAPEKAQTSATKTATTRQAGNLMEELFPWKTVGNYQQINPEGTISKNQAYGTVSEWEKLNKSYTGGPTASSIGAKNAATSVRGTLSEGDLKLQALNKLYQIGTAIEPYKKWMIGGGLALPFLRNMVYGALNMLKGEK